MHLYNVQADRGSEHSRTYKNNGLVYHILDKKGNRIGVPIKASSFYNKPTLKFLEAKFTENSRAKQPSKTRVKNAIDLAILRQKNIPLGALMKALEREGIHAVLRQNSGGLIYGITFVDHETKCVFNGSDLGKEYSAKGMQERCGINISAEQRSALNTSLKVQSKSGQISEEAYQQNMPAQITDSRVGASPLEVLLQAEHTSGFVPYQLTEKGDKKRKKSKSRRL